MSWVVEVWVDPVWYQLQESPDPLPSAGLVAVVPLSGTSLVVGRRSTTGGSGPDVDCGSDPGASRRHARLTTDGGRWWVADLDSANGTFVGAAGDPLPEQPIGLETPYELAAGDRVYLGAWTRLVLRRADEPAPPAGGPGAAPSANT